MDRHFNYYDVYMYNTLHYGHLRSRKGKVIRITLLLLLHI